MADSCIWWDEKKLQDVLYIWHNQGNRPHRIARFLTPDLEGCFAGQVLSSVHMSLPSWYHRANDLTAPIWYLPIIVEPQSIEPMDLLINRQTGIIWLADNQNCLNTPLLRKIVTDLESYHIIERSFSKACLSDFCGPFGAIGKIFLSLVEKETFSFPSMIGRI